MSLGDLEVKIYEEVAILGYQADAIFSEDQKMLTVRGDTLQDTVRNLEERLTYYLCRNNNSWEEL